MNLNMSSALASVAFGVSVVVLITSTLQTALKRSWYLSALFFATAFQAKSAYETLYRHAPHDHSAFTDDYFNSSFMAPFIVLATYTTFIRLDQYITASRTGRPAPPPKLGQAFALSGISSSIIIHKLAHTYFEWFLSSAPIMGVRDAQLRLVYFQRGMMIMRLAYGLQLVCMAYLGNNIFKRICNNKGFDKTAVEMTSQRFIASLFANMIFVFCWTLHRFVAYGSLAEHRLGFVGSEWFIWTCDTLPILVCLVNFCLAHPGFHLPKEYVGFFGTGSSSAASMTVDEKTNVDDTSV